MRASLPFLLALLVGCPTGGDSDDDDSASTCADLLSDGASWQLDGDGEDGQIHPHTVLAGDTLVTTFNRPDGGSDFSVFVVAHACDGTLLWGPVRVDGGDGNATDPHATVAGDRALLAWQTDDGGSPFNLSVRLAAVDLGSGDVLVEDRRAEFLDGGDPMPGQSWMARLAARADGVDLVAVRAGEGQQFHVVHQVLDLNGSSVGDALALTDSQGPGAFEPAVVVDGDELVVAWQDSFDGSEGFGAARVSGATASALTWPLLEPAGIGVALTTSSADVWGAVGRSSGAVAGREGEAGDSISVAPALSPGVVARPGGAVVAWAEGSAANATWWLSPVGGERVEVGSGAAYPADIVALDEAHVLITRAIGSSPVFRLEAEVVAVP